MVIIFPSSVKKGLEEIHMESHTGEHTVTFFGKQFFVFWGIPSQLLRYRYEDDPILGHRLYREIRRVEHAKDSTKKSKGKGVSTVPVISYNWEAVASNFDEFKVAAEKLFSSRNRTEVSLGKKLKFTYLPEIEKIHKKKEKLLKKQQREAILLDSCLTVNGLTSGRSRRERKHVTYTFEIYRKNENAVEVGPSPLCKGFYGETPEKLYYKAKTDEGKAETLHRSYRQRKRSQRYTKDYVEAISDIDLDFDSDDDIMGEAVYDEEYLRRRKRYKASLSENDDEFQLDQVANDGDDEVGTSLNVNEDTKDLQWYKRFPLLTPQGTKLKSIDEIQTGIRRSKRSTRSRINYRQLDTFGANTKYGKSEKCNASDPDASSDALNDTELSTSQDREEEDGVNKAQQQYTEKPIVPVKESRSVRRKFLVLNELVPIAGFDDASVLVKDKHVNNNGGKCSAAH
ncbi:DDT domain-containing protein DDR4 [Zea mays]|uniref:DDT domain-containing protein DDR4 n=1 Tax=Zea mays TaxID=4577 RepID=A0A1D6L842_MAIZE|nr:DDT domain-containing protein DDR4 [Zea mays]